MKSWQDLPDHARVWIYQANRFLSAQEVGEIEQMGEDFVHGWSTHGTPLEASVAVFNNLHVVIFADEEQVQASGCSIDKSVHFIKALEATYGVDFFDRLRVAFHNDDVVGLCHVTELSESVEEGTLVFDNLVQSKGEFQNSWKKAPQDTWVATHL